MFPPTSDRLSFTESLSAMANMKRYKLRVPALIAFVVLVCCVITVGVSAYEPCQQAVKKVIKKVEWPHYSKATVARWVAWGKDHPDYVAPKRKPRVSTQEVAEMMTFACNMPTLESAGPDDVLLQEEPAEELGFSMDDSRPFTVELASVSSPVALVNVPVAPAVVDVGETPEPQSWVLLATGLAAFALLWRKRSGLQTEQELTTA